MAHASPRDAGDSKPHKTALDFPNSQELGEGL